MLGCGVGGIFRLFSTFVGENVDDMHQKQLDLLLTKYQRKTPRELHFGKSSHSVLKQEINNIKLKGHQTNPENLNWFINDFW